MFLVACGAQKEETLAAGQPRLGTVELSLGAWVVTAELADSEQEREQGLMYRDSLGQDEGMLFAYEDEELRYFWMKNTSLPLSIAFINSSGRIMRIDDMEPFSENQTPSVFQAKYALEMHRGWYSTHGVRTGQVVGGIPPESLD
jgi:uncharacterized membrane protein (UPF0127 family)